jgi:hypothetical protein
MASTRLQPWREHFRGVFELAGEDWKPTSGVRTTLNDSRDRMTFAASFRQPDGAAVKLTVESKRAEDGQWYVTKQKLDLRLTFGAQH